MSEPPGTLVEPGRTRLRQLPDRDRGTVMALSGALLLLMGCALGALVATNVSAADVADLPVNSAFVDIGDRLAWLHRVAVDLKIIGAGRNTGPIVLVFTAVLLVLRRWRWAVFVFVSAEGGFLISDLMKYLVERPRPAWEAFAATETGTSFPSGHTLAGITAWVAMGVTLLFVVPKPWSTVLGWPLIIMGVAIGPSRLVLGHHWVTDVLGSWVLGFGWLLLVAGVLLRLWGPVPGQDQP